MAVYLTPGPSQPYPGLHDFIEDAWAEDILAISHRGSMFQSVYKRTDAALRAVMDIPKDYSVLFVGSATEAMERTIQGTVRRRSHHLVSGAFAEKWFEIAKALGKQPSVCRVPAGHEFKSKDLTIPEDAELVCLTQNETSTGSMFPTSLIRKIATNRDKQLIALDVVSSAPMISLPWEVLDVVLFSVQKAFGLPAGLGVLIISPRALRRAQQLEQRGISIGSYHSLSQLAAARETFQTPATPNVLGIYLLGRVAEAMDARGMGTLRAENLERARLLYEVLNTHAVLSPFVQKDDWRSPTVIVAHVPDGNTALHDALVGHGLIVGKGYGTFKDEHLRIANFPSLDEKSLETLIRFLREYG